MHFIYNIYILLIVYSLDYIIISDVAYKKVDYELLIPDAHWMALKVTYYTPFYIM